MNNKLPILIIIFSLFVCGDPSITSTKSTFNNNDTIRIFGSNFGVKSYAPAIVFDQMESGSFSTYWSSNGDLTVNSDNNRSSRSSYNGFNNFDGSGNKDIGFFTGSNSILGSKWFCQYWFKLGSNWQWGNFNYPDANNNLSNVKIFRFWNPGEIDENVVTAINGTDVQTAVEYVAPDMGGGDYYWETVQDDMTKNAWHCLQVEFTESDVNQSNGKYKMWFDGKAVCNFTTLMTRETYSEYKRPMCLGFYNSWDDCSRNPCNNSFYIDDVYADTSFARVEIGDRSIYDSCTHREIQKISNWKTDTIKVLFTQGSFSTNDTAYVFVIDNSSSKSSGYKIVVGKSNISSINSGRARNVAQAGWSVPCTLSSTLGDSAKMFMIDSLAGSSWTIRDSTALLSSGSNSSLSTSGRLPSKKYYFKLYSRTKGNVYDTLSIDSLYTLRRRWF